MIEFKYRPDIDGLRAVAVILVLLFHANLGFSGGFIGVDVFFVISGFLITGLILKEQRNGTFSISNFWVRRIRRIIPAATFVVATTLAAGEILLLPADYDDLAKSTVSQQLILSNVFFWQSIGYFAGPSDLKPLLHTWSLAVEEQFYLVYPFLLLATRQFTNKRLAGLLILLAIASFVLSEWGVHAHPEATFFLLPTRAWELLLGGTLCFAHLPGKLSQWPTNLISLFGLASIVGSALLYDSSTRFPGATALAPCLGTALIIYANSGQLTWVGKLLAAKPIVFVGLVSYSLYLWHWPMLAFARYWLGPHLPIPVSVSILIASFGIACLSWRFIEAPFRKGKLSSKWYPVTAAVISLLTVVSLALLVSVFDGLPYRFPAEVRRFFPDSPPTELSADNNVVARDDLPLIGNENNDSTRVDFLIWGDSHAASIGQLCDELAKERGLRGLVAANGGAVPLLDVWRSGRGVAEGLQERNQAILSIIENRRIKNVILVARWSLYVEGYTNQEAVNKKREKTFPIIMDTASSEVSHENSQAVLYRGLERTISKLHDLGVSVWVMEQVPLQHWDDPAKTAVLSMWQLGKPLTGVSLEEHLSRQARIRQVFRSFTSEDFVLLDPTRYCFDQSEISIIYNENNGFYRDGNHLTFVGTKELLTPLLRPVFQVMADNPTSGSE